MLNLKTYKVYLSPSPIFSYDIITSSTYGFYTAAAYHNIPHPLISHTSIPHTFTTSPHDATPHPLPFPISHTSTPHTFITSPHDTTPNPISDDQITSPHIPYHTT